MATVETGFNKFLGGGVGTHLLDIVKLKKYPSQHVRKACYRRGGNTYYEFDTPLCNWTIDVVQVLAWWRGELGRAPIVLVPNAASPNGAAYLGAGTVRSTRANSIRAHHS